jgi:ATP phosphoribosyltransferase regulatory subunit HisZ
MEDKLAPVITPARYAKGKMAVHCPSDGSGFKTRAARIASAMPGRYSNRERAYIMSPSAAKRVKAAYEAERDARLGDRNGALGYVL